MSKNQIKGLSFYPFIPNCIINNNQFKSSSNIGEVPNYNSFFNIHNSKGEENNSIRDAKENDYLDDNTKEFINKKIIDLSFLDYNINEPEGNNKEKNEINECDNTKLNNFSLEIKSESETNKMFDVINKNNDLNKVIMYNNIYKNDNYYQQNSYNNLIYNNQIINNQDIINHSLSNTNNISLNNNSIHNKNAINIIDIKTNIEKRTTIRMLNIPSYYKPKDLAKKLDEKLGISPKKENRVYNFIYIPIKRGKNKEGLINAGFAFINFVHPKHILKFYSLFHGKHLKSKTSKKVCIITFASKQGIIIKNENLENSNGDKYIYFTDTKNHFQLLNE